MLKAFLLLALFGQVFSVPLTHEEEYLPLTSARWKRAALTKDEKDSPSGTQPRVSYSRDTVVGAGEDATLDCGVEGLDLSNVENFRIDWSKIDEDDPVQSLPITSGEVLVYSPDKKYELIHPEGTHQYSLKINGVQKADTGLYRCLVYFAEDQFVTPKVYLAIEEAPHFQDDFVKQITVTEGDSVSFECKPAGNPEPTTTWQRIHHGPTFYGGLYESNTLDIASVSLKDQGRYSCYAENKVGSATTEIVLTVEYSPLVEITTPELGLDPKEDEYSIECEVQSFPESEVTWYKGEDAIYEDVSMRIEETREKVLTKQGRSDQILKTVTPTVVKSTITLKTNTDEAIGTYSCSATNSVGTRKATTSVSYKEPPQIVEQGARRIFYHDEDSIGRSEIPTSIDCLASGVPAPEYRWTKNNKPLVWQAEPRYSMDPESGSLLIEDPKLSDNGWYQCIAYNSLGVAKSDLMYFFNASTIDFDTENFEGGTELVAEEGRPFQMSCPDVTADPAPNVTWIVASPPKDGQSAMKFFDASNRTIVGPNGVAYFSHIVADDDSEKSGKTYMCIASNEAFPTDLSIGRTVTIKVEKPSDGVSNSASDDVNIEPLIVYSSPEKVKFNGSQENKLWCIFAGEPVAQIIWTDKDGAILPGEDFDYGNFNSSLIFKNTLKKQEGNYKCSGSNAVGPVITHDMEVTIEMPPVFEERLDKVRVTEGDSVTFVCGAKGDGVLTYQWAYNGREILTTSGVRRKISGNELTIDPVLESDTGNYACNATSTYGYAYGQTTLTVMPYTNERAAVVQAANGGAQSCTEVAELKEELASVKSTLEELRDFVQNTRTAQADGTIELIQRIAGKLDLLTQEEKDLIAAQQEFKREQSDFQSKILRQSAITVETKSSGQSKDETHETIRLRSPVFFDTRRKAKL